MTLHLALNGRFLAQNVTGVQRVAIEFTSALDRLLASGEVGNVHAELLVPRRSQLITNLPLQRISLRREGRLQGHAWEQLELPMLARNRTLLCLGNTAPLALLARKHNRVFAMVHDLSYQYFPDAYSRTFRMLYGAVVPMVLARSAHIFTVSSSEQASILRHHGRRISRDRITVVQNGGGEGSPHPTSDEPSSLRPNERAVPSRTVRKRQALYVGSLTRRKNAAGVLEATVRLARSHDADIVFIGSSAPMFKATGLTVPRDVEKRFRFLGQVDDPDQIEAEYRAASVFLFPSFYEASPLPPVEAMNLGLPVVAGDIPSLRERCSGGAVLVDPNDSDEIVLAAARLLDDPAHWSAQQEAGMAAAAEYSWERQARSILAAIQGVAS